MRIAYCIHSLHSSGGMERVLSLKASYLAEKAGYDVYIITASLKSRKAFFPLSPKVHLHDLDCSDHPAMLFYARKLEAFLLEIKADVCISMCGGELYVLPDLRDGSVKIAEFHFAHKKFMLKYGGTALGRIYAGIRTRMLEKAVSRLSAFVVLTKEDMLSWQGIAPKLVQIYNPLSFSPNHAAVLTQKSFIAVGRLEAQKNYQDMLAAWKIVAERHPDWQLKIFGKGDCRNSLMKQISSLGLENKVLLLGHTKNIREEMLASSGLVMSSLYEGFPMVLLEAQAAGLPIVSYTCPCGPAEIVEDGKSGILVKPGDVEGLASGICRLIEDEEFRCNCGRNSYEGARRFEMDGIMQKWDSLFKSLL